MIYAHCSAGGRERSNTRGVARVKRLDSAAAARRRTGEEIHIVIQFNEILKTQ